MLNAYQQIILLLILALLIALGIPVRYAVTSPPPTYGDPVIVESLQFQTIADYPPQAVVHGFVYVTRYCYQLDLVVGLYDSYSYEVSRVVFTSFDRAPGAFSFIANGPPAWSAIRAQLVYAVCQ